MQGDTPRRKRLALCGGVSPPEQMRGDNMAAQLAVLEAAVPRGAQRVGSWLRRPLETGAAKELDSSPGEGGER